MTDNEFARERGIPKAFRQYAKRYGKGVRVMAQMHKRIAAPRLDHWGDKIAAAHRALALIQGR